MTAEFEVCGDNTAAPFTLKVRRGEGMALLSMDWKDGRPPSDFVGFAIEYQPPAGDHVLALRNRLWFPQADGSVDRKKRSTRVVADPEVPLGALSAHDAERQRRVLLSSSPRSSWTQPTSSATASRRGRDRTAAARRIPGQLNVAFTRGFVSSQAFVEKYEDDGPISTLLPPSADDGLRSYRRIHARTRRWTGWASRRGGRSSTFSTKRLRIRQPRSGSWPTT